MWLFSTRNARTALPMKCSRKRQHTILQLEVLEARTMLDAAPNGAQTIPIQPLGSISTPTARQILGTPNIELPIALLANQVAIDMLVQSQPPSSSQVLQSIETQVDQAANPQAIKMLANEAKMANDITRVGLDAATIAAPEVPFPEKQEALKDAMEKVQDGVDQANEILENPLLSPTALLLSSGAGAGYSQRAQNTFDLSLEEDVLDLARRSGGGQQPTQPPNPSPSPQGKPQGNSQGDQQTFYYN